MSEGNIPYSSKFDHLVYLRVFEGCNLRCKHCFIPANPKKIELDFFDEIPLILKDRIPKDSKVLIQWHGGEPTMLGASYLRTAIEKLNSYKGFKWQHGIQTNLLSYNDDWKSVYKDYFDSHVGVSWDPKIRIYNGDDNSNDRFEKNFWNNFEKLINDGLEPYLVVTGTKTFFETFKNPIQFFEFIYSKGIRKAHIERVTETGYARQNWETIGVNNAEYSKYMSKFARGYKAWQLNQSENQDKLFLSPFDGMFSSIQRINDSNTKGYGCLSGTCDTRFHTIDANGYKFGCTAVNSEVDNSQSNKKLDINLKNLTKDREKRIIFNCNLCKFRNICNTGCMAIDFDDGSGECSGGQQFFEELKRLHELK